jgi:hypothetical protein
MIGYFLHYTYCKNKNNYLVNNFIENIILFNLLLTLSKFNLLQIHLKNLF